jgi:hypothetical protein
MQMFGRHRLVHAVACSVTLATACGDDDAGSGDETTGDTSSDPDSGPTATESSTDAPMMTTMSPDTSGDPSTADDADSTTGIGTPGSDVRVMYELGTMLRVTDIVDGVASEPFTVLENPGNAFYQRPTARWLAVSGVDPNTLTAVDIAGAPPLDSHPFAPTGSVTDVWLDTSNAAGDRWIVRSSSGAGGDLHVFEVNDDGPVAPFRVDADLAEDVIVAGAVFVLAESRVAFRARDERAGTAGLWLGPADAGAPALEPITEMSEGEVNAPVAPPGGEWLVYTTDGITADALHAWFVDLATSPPLPVELELLPGMESHGFPKPAPDGSGVVVRQQVEGGAQDLAWIAVDDGVAAPPLQISTGASAGLATFQPYWSPDGRWLSFATDEPRALYLIGFDDGVPGEPVAIGDDGVELDTEPQFASDGRHAYAFEQGDLQGRLIRVALDGDVLGDVQAVSPVLHNYRHYVVSEDARTVCWVGSESADAQEAWCADISDDAPGAPERVDVDVDVAGGELIFAGRPDDDASHMLFSVTMEDGRRAVVVDRTNGTQHVLEGGVALPSAFTVMFALR